MLIRLENYVGQTLDIIYLDQAARITRRRVKLWAVDPGTVHAYCFYRRAPRRFKRANILSAMAAKRERMWA